MQLVARIVPQQGSEVMADNQARAPRRRRARAGVSVALAASLSLALAACGGGDGDDQDVEEVHIGVVLPLSGPTAQNGQNSQRGLELARDLINEAGGIESMGGAQIVLDIVDATSEPAAAANAASEMVSGNDAPLAIVGAYASGLTVTVARETERAGIPLLTTAFSDELTQEGYEFLFQLPAQATAIGEAQMQYTVEIAEAAGSPIESAAIIYANNAYGETQAQGLQSMADELGVDVALFEGYDPAITDATPVAQQAINAGADAIFSIAYVSDGVLVARALQSLGNDVPVIGGVGGYITPDFLAGLGEEGVEGYYSVNTSALGDYGDINTAYEEQYGTFMPQEAHDNAAGLYVIAEALEQNPTLDPEELAQTLHEGTFTMGAAGSMPGGEVSFDETGANEIAVPLMTQWQSGELVGVWPEDYADAEPIWPSGE
jgi:branched-chain amino acid transport system substrate-binding protein